jgi:hypothetical protein
VAKKLELKPRHGWRAFVGEVGIIVLGVLIALSAQEAVDTWQWQQRVNQADKAFRIDLDSAVMNAYVRLATEPCLKKRLSELEAKLNEPGESWQATPEKLNFPDPDLAASYHGYLPVPPITTTGWNNALADGTTSHLPYMRASYLADAYDAATRFRDDRRMEVMAIPELAPLATDRTLSSSQRADLLKSVRKLQALDALIQDDSEAILFTVKQTESGFTDDLIRSESTGLVHIARNVRGKCVTEPNIPS